MSLNELKLLSGLAWELVDWLICIVSSFRFILFIHEMELALPWRQRFSDWTYLQERILTSEKRTKITLTLKPYMYVRTILFIFIYLFKYKETSSRILRRIQELQYGDYSRPITWTWGMESLLQLSERNETFQMWVCYTMNMRTDSRWTLRYLLDFDQKLVGIYQTYMKKRSYSCDVFGNTIGGG